MKLTFTKFNLPAIFTVIQCCFSQNVFAANADLTLTVAGTRTAAPQWQDGVATNIASLPFTFSGVAGVAAANVDSATSTAKLINATSYPATIAVTTPIGCSVGVTPVTNVNVALLVAGVAAAATFNLASNANQTFALRFLAAGNYGDKIGAVACTTPGLLRYSY